MKIQHALLPLAAAMMIAGCGSRGTAQSVVQQSEGLLSTKREEAALIAPEQLKTAEATLAEMKKDFDDRRYSEVVDVVPKYNTELKALDDAMAQKQIANAQATQEWSALNTEVPKSVEAIQARVDSLKPESLPKDVTKEELETAKTELETIKVTWTEATNAASSNNTAEAVEKGRLVQAKTEELKNTLGMNPTLASAG